MADTARTLAALQALLADNTSGDISAQDARDFLVSAYQPQQIPPGGRLTLTTALPITTADVTGATNVFYTPHINNTIPIYDGSSWKLYTFSEITLALGTLTSGKNYDVFIYDNSGTLTLEALVWTNDTTRATALVRQDGVWCKTGALSRRYLGTFRTTSTTTTEDSVLKRFLSNAYNKSPRKLKVTDTTTTWTYNSLTWRQVRATAANKCEVVLGLAENLVELYAQNTSENYSKAGGNVGSIAGIGVDWTSGQGQEDLQSEGGYLSNSVLAAGPLYSVPQAFYQAIPAVGYHSFTWLEACLFANTTNFFGGDGTTTMASGLNGMLGTVEG